MLTNGEMADEFWMLTKGVLQDGRIDTDEARVVKRWIEEHVPAGSESLLRQLEGYMADNYIDPRESARIAEALGGVLRRLRQAK